MYYIPSARRCMRVLAVIGRYLPRDSELSLTHTHIMTHIYWTRHTCALFDVSVLFCLHIRGA